MTWLYLRSVAGFAIGRGLPGIVSFALLPILTRELGPSAFAQYAFLMTGVGLANTLGFQWLRSAALRLHPKEDGSSLHEFIDAVNTLFLVNCLLVPPAVALAILLLPATPTAALLASCLYAVAQARYELLRESTRATLNASSYARAGLLRSVIGFAAAWTLIRMNMGISGAFLGLSAGAMAGMVGAGNDWSMRKPSLGRALPHARRIFAYGYPLIGASLLALAYDNVDRIFLSRILDQPTLGLYVGATMLAQQAIGVTMSTVHLGGLPVVLRTNTNSRNEALQRHLLMLLAVGLPTVITLASLGNPINRIILGEKFGPIGIITGVAGATAFLSCIRHYYSSVTCQLNLQTTKQIPSAIIALIAALLVVPLLASILGPIGASVGCLVSSIVGLATAELVSHRIGAPPWPLNEVFRIGISAGVMAIALTLLPPPDGALQLTFTLALGSTIYIGALFTLNASDLRGRFRTLWASKTSA